MRLLLFITFLSLISCRTETKKRSTKSINTDLSVIDSLNTNTIKEENTAVVEKKVIAQKKYTSYEDSLIGIGFIDVNNLDSTFIIDLKYTTDDNFTNSILYTELHHCFLQKEVAKLLVDAHKRLKKKKPNLRMVLYDCLRPQSVQYKMWDIVKGTEKQRYVAQPKYGSIHNFGAAVDLGLIDTAGIYQDMGSKFDEFDLIAQPRHEMEMLKQGKITRAALDNRWLLKTCMKEAGFRTILTEWWHYNAYSLKYTRQNFSIVK